MKTLVLTASLLSAAGTPPMAPPVTIEQPQTLDGTWRARLQDTWTRKDGERWVSLQLSFASPKNEMDSDRNSGFSIPMEELEGLGARGDRWTASDVRFNVRRDAGTV